MSRKNRGGRGNRSQYPTVPCRMPSALLPLVNRASSILFKTGHVSEVLPSRWELTQRLTPLVAARAIRSHAALKLVLDIIYGTRSDIRS